MVLWCRAFYVWGLEKDFGNNCYQPAIQLWHYLGKTWVPISSTLSFQNTKVARTWNQLTTTAGSLKASHEAMRWCMEQERQHQAFSIRLITSKISSTMGRREYQRRVTNRTHAHWLAVEMPQNFMDTKLFPDNSFMVPNKKLEGHNTQTVNRQMAPISEKNKAN